MWEVSGGGQEDGRAVGADSVNPVHAEGFRLWCECWEGVGMAEKSSDWIFSNTVSLLKSY